MFETFKKQIKPIKLMLVSDCFECFVAAFTGPYLTKAIYGVTLGRVWSQGNTELFGNLFLTEERKDYDRLQSSCCATANMLAAGLVCLTSKKFALPFSIMLIVWCSSYFMDAFSMGYVFRYGMKNKLLEPRSEK